jgi:lipopolysaccharide transport system permease protein
MDRPLKETVYTPDSELLNFGALLRNMGRDLLASRELAWRLLVRNISAQYRQSLLGYAWAFVPPIFTSLIWIFLQSQKVLGVGDTGMPYIVFVITGTVLWQTFVEALNSPLQVVNESKSMLTKINFPREALILAGVGQVLFNFAIRALLLVVVMLWFRITPHASLLLVPLGVLALIGLGTSIGLVLTPIGMLYQDIGRGLGFATAAWFFLTPVIYPVPKASFAATLIELNPVTPLLVTTRDWLVFGSSNIQPSFLLVTAGLFVLLLVGWIQYRIAMPHLISRMSA